MFNRGDKPAEPAVQTSTEPTEREIGIAINFTSLNTDTTRGGFTQAEIEAFIKKCDSDPDFKAWARARFASVGDRPAKLFDQSLAGQRDGMFTKPVTNPEPYFIRNKEFVVIPSKTGVSVYKVKKIEGETATIGEYAEWTYPAGTSENDLRYKVEQELKVVRNREIENKLREPVLKA